MAGTCDSIIQRFQAHQLVLGGWLLYQELMQPRTVHTAVPPMIPPKQSCRCSDTSVDWRMPRTCVALRSRNWRMLGSQKPAAAPARSVWRVLVRYVPATGSRHQRKRFVPWIERLHAWSRRSAGRPFNRGPRLTVPVARGQYSVMAVPTDGGQPNLGLRCLIHRSIPYRS